MRVFKWLNGILEWFEKIWTGVASVSMFAIMIISFVDVALRYVFNSPLIWAYDFISLYLMVALFFLALASTQADERNVRVDILLSRVSVWARNVMELIGNALSAIVMFGIAYFGAIKFSESFQAGEVVAGAIPWPTWATAIFVPLGAGLLVLRLLSGVGSRLLALVHPLNETLDTKEEGL